MGVASALRGVDAHNERPWTKPALYQCHCWLAARQWQEVFRGTHGHYWQPSESWLAAEQRR